MGQIKLWSMEHRLEIARNKIQKLMKKNNGTIINLCVSPGLPAFWKKVVEADMGVMLELVHPYSSIIIAPAFGSIQQLLQAVPPFSNLPHEEFTRFISLFRHIVPDDVYMMALPEEGLVALYQDPLSDDYLLAMSRAGLDQIHLHRPTLEDYEEAIKMCHRNGLLCDAYISHPDDHVKMGVPARTVKDVVEVAKKLEKAGADIVGLMTGMTHRGLEAKEISPEVRERLKALAGAVDVPTITEGGINPSNYKAVKETGVNIITIYAALREISENAMFSAIRSLVE